LPPRSYRAGGRPVTGRALACEKCDSSLERPPARPSDDLADGRRVQAPLPIGVPLPERGRDLRRLQALAVQLEDQPVAPLRVGVLAAAATTVGAGQRAEARLAPGPRFEHGHAPRPLTGELPGRPGMLEALARAVPSLSCALRDVESPLTLGAPLVDTPSAARLLVTAPRAVPPRLPLEPVPVHSVYGAADDARHRSTTAGGADVAGPRAVPSVLRRPRRQLELAPTAGANDLDLGLSPPQVRAPSAAVMTLVGRHLGRDHVKRGATLTADPGYAAHPAGGVAREHGAPPRAIPLRPPASRVRLRLTAPSADHRPQLRSRRQPLAAQGAELGSGWASRRWEQRPAHRARQLGRSIVLPLGSGEAPARAVPPPPRGYPARGLMERHAALLAGAVGLAGSTHGGIIPRNCDSSLEWSLRYCEADAARIPLLPMGSSPPPATAASAV
jgi:hypothetical protein